MRRRILQALADGQPRVAKQLASIASRRISATLKHLVVLRDAGLILSRQDPQDGHRQQYILGPGIPVTRTERGLAMDFGCCLVRIPPPGGVPR